MNLADLIAPADLKAAIDAKLVNRRSDDNGLWILNYSDAALYTDGAWDNPAVRQCRGLIVDDNDQIVARPWAKFFNHGQAEAGLLALDAPVEVTDKLDGSLGIIYRAADGSPRVATRGSFQSDQALHATEILQRKYPDLASLSSITPLVEIIYPSNRIVCDYGDFDDLVLLGGVVITTGEYLGPEATRTFTAWPGPMTTTFEYQSLRDALAAPPRPGAEGMCVRYLHEHRIVKIKQDDYVALHRIVTGLSERSVWEHMTSGAELGDLLARLPDELHRWTRDVWVALHDAVDCTHRAAINAHYRILAALGDGWGRKEYALAAQKHAHLRPYLFNVLDGKDPRPAILRTLKPAGDTRPRTFSEDVA